MQEPHPATELATEWFDGRSPRPQRSWLRCESGELVVRLAVASEGVAPASTRRYPLSEIRWPERRSQGMRQTDLPDGSVIQHGRATEWDAWAQANGLRESRVVGWMQSWRSAAGAVAGTVGFLVAAWLWGLPWLATTIAHNVPQGVEERIGEVSLKQLESLFLKPSRLPAAQQAKIRADFQKLVDTAYPEGNAPVWRLSFHDSKALGPNAFALPGGGIVITDALVTLLEDTPDATLGVLAHELGHVEHRHGLDLMVRASLVSALVGLVVGDASGFLATVPATLATQAYSRDAERESDARAAVMLHASGISPAVMATFFERILAMEGGHKGQGTAGSRNSDRDAGPKGSPDTDGEDGAGLSLPIAISSHPDHAERIAFFKNWTPPQRQP
ncbi:MAG: M48 family metallopeptidase [Hydrogenophaga sp.]